ncbi:MAG: PhoPQ-activated pathogenicity-related family protein [Verrucomicrobiales bacterium]
MRIAKTLCFKFLLPLFLCSPLTAKESAPTELQAYLDLKDESTSWEMLKKITVGESDVWLIKLQSQTWQGIPWTHDLLLVKPHSAPAGEKILLVNSGGSFNIRKPGSLTLGATLAQRINAPVAVLLGIPKQPLFGGLKEDDLIAETFIRYLDTGDATWPLLFPMVKSLVKAMDSIEEFTAAEWEKPISEFIVTGASKRGWTTWLTAAADPRVTALAPMVIDVLNINEQLDHQKKSLGGPSEQISPYTKRGLVPMPDTERARRLWRMVDPYSYREKFTQPKLVVLGNNDRYWSTDALNLYWDGIPGPKYISYSPNAGHGLTQIDENGEKTDPMRAIDNISAFVRLQLDGKLPPEISWQHGDTPDGELQLEVSTNTPPREARLWYATSKSRDFRDSRWHSKPVEVDAEGKIHLTHPAPTEEHYAYYVDLAYPVGNLTLWLCTQLRIASPQ